MAHNIFLKKLWSLTLSNSSQQIIRSTPKLMFYPAQKTFMTSSNMHRSILHQIYISLRTVFHRKRPRLVGTDDAGIRYFEAPPNKASEHTHLSKLPKRFYLIPGQKSLEDAFMNTYIETPSLPPEWQSWLNHRRSDPPTKEEIEANNLSKQQRLIRAAELEAKHNEERLEMIRQGLLQENKSEQTSSQQQSNEKSTAFPVYPDMKNSFEDDYPSKTLNEKQNK
ncbi:unnamed protein product [Trichobilharzia szidati]|nr:unnamed protein product [Trichobilharzia szidati]